MRPPKCGPRGPHFSIHVVPCSGCWVMPRPVVMGRAWTYERGWSCDGCGPCCCGYGHATNADMRRRVRPCDAYSKVEPDIMRHKRVGRSRTPRAAICGQGKRGNLRSPASHRTGTSPIQSRTFPRSSTHRKPSPRRPKHGPLGAVLWRAPQTLPRPTDVERSGKNPTVRSDRGFKTPKSGEGGAWRGRHVEVEQADAEGSRAGNP
jgi:hypothetical protein